MFLVLTFGEKDALLWGINNRLTLSDSSLITQWLNKLFWENQASLLKKKKNPFKIPTPTSSSVQLKLQEIAPIPVNTLFLTSNTVLVDLNGFILDQTVFLLSMTYHQTGDKKERKHVYYSLKLSLNKERLTLKQYSQLGPTMRYPDIVIWKLSDDGMR